VKSAGAARRMLHQRGLGRVTRQAAGISTCKRPKNRRPPARMAKTSEVSARPDRRRAATRSAKLKKRRKHSQRLADVLGRPRFGVLNARIAAFADRGVGHHSLADRTAPLRPATEAHHLGNDCTELDCPEFRKVASSRRQSRCDGRPHNRFDQPIGPRPWVSERPRRSVALARPLLPLGTRGPPGRPLAGETQVHHAL